MPLPREKKNTRTRPHEEGVHNNECAGLHVRRNPRSLSPVPCRGLYFRFSVLFPFHWAVLGCRGLRGLLRGVEAYCHAPGAAGQSLQDRLHAITAALMRLPAARVWILQTTQEPVQIAERHSARELWFRSSQRRATAKAGRCLNDKVGYTQPQSNPERDAAGLCSSSACRQGCL